MLFRGYEYCWIAETINFKRKYTTKTPLANRSFREIRLFPGVDFAESKEYFCIICHLMKGMVT